MRALIIAPFALLAVLVAWTTPPDALAQRGQIGVVYSAWYDTIAGHQSGALTQASRRQFRQPVPQQPAPAVPVRRVHPLLDQWLQDSSNTVTKTLLVTYADTVTIPRFPEADMTLPRTAPANAAKLDTAEFLIQDIRARRAAQYTADSTQLIDVHQGRIRYKYWATQTLLVDMPLGNVAALATEPGVVYVQPANAGETPPQVVVDNPELRDDVAAAREHINTDAYRALGYDYGWMSLLDTGVFDSHALLKETGQFGVLGDCVDGGTNCVTVADGFNTSDVHSDGHGTASAAIIMGNDALGDRFEGVTTVVLDAFRVYDPPSSHTGSSSDPTLNTAAAEIGIESALTNCDRIIVAEMQADEDEWGALSSACETAFAAGASIIAANGNKGSEGPGSVRAPANNHKAIGVGIFDVIETSVTEATQSQGPTTDGRVKPDVQAPTWSETATAEGETDVGGFGGTSGATPYVAGAAALLRNWMAHHRVVPDPGHVYAQLIVCGHTPFATTTEKGFDDDTGAGHLRLPDNAYGWWGSVYVGDGEECLVTMEVEWDDLESVEAAVWWPEGMQVVDGMETDTHNNIDIVIMAPDGSEAVSEHASSVFERASHSALTGEEAEGRWGLNIKGMSVGAERQLVYFAAYAKTTSGAGTPTPKGSWWPWWVTWARVWVIVIPVSLLLLLIWGWRKRNA